MSAHSLHTNSVFAGIDPGLRGAVVIYDAYHNTVLDARMIPTQEVQRNKKRKRVLDIPSLVLMVRQMADAYPVGCAFMELVGANRIHGRLQGVTSMFSFGNTNGAIEASLVAASIPYARVPPARWKAALGCTQDKDQTLAKASELIPAAAKFWTPQRGERTKEDCKGVAEAALIAYWGAYFGIAQQAA